MQSDLQRLNGSKPAGLSDQNVEISKVQKVLKLCVLSDNQSAIYTVKYIYTYRYRNAYTSFSVAAIFIVSYARAKIKTGSIAIEMISKDKKLLCFIPIFRAKLIYFYLLLLFYPSFQFQTLTNILVKFFQIILVAIKIKKKKESVHCLIGCLLPHFKMQ